MSQLTYIPGTITGNALDQSNSGSPSVCIAITTHEEGPRVLYANLYLTEAAFDSSVKVLREVIGWEGFDIRELNEPIFKGIEVTAACAWETYEGKDKFKVKFINKPGGGGVKKLDPMQAETLARSLNARLAALGRASGSARPAAGSPPVGGRSARPAPSPARGEPELPPFAPPSDDLPY
jgi:hypothetical protein